MDQGYLRPAEINYRPFLRAQNGCALRPVTLHNDADIDHLLTRELAFGSNARLRMR